MQWLCFWRLDPFFVNLRAFRRNPIAFLIRRTEEDGDIARFALGFLQFALVTHPDFVQDVLVTHEEQFVKGLGLQRAKQLLGQGLLTSEGDFHKRQRRLMQPAFHREAIHSYGETMVSFTTRLCDAWQVGTQIDIADEMRRLTLAIVAKALFSTDVEHESTDIGEALNTAVQMFQLGMPVGLAKLLYRLPLPGSQRLKRAQARLDSIIYRIIQEHKDSGTRPRDVLSMLLGAQNLEIDDEMMTDRQVRDEALTLFLAGHETTAVALAWTWYLLSEHPDAEARLHHEIDKVLGGRPPTVADIPNLIYARKVFTESLRLYPPAWIISRMALNDYTFNGHTIAAGTHVFVSPYLMHRDARFFIAPEHFMPERWDTDVARFQQPFSFLPFGAGPRNCIGESFAWMEGILILATIAQRWRFRLVKGHPIELEPRITLRPKYGVKMIAEAK
jgi:cytochrome P450